MSGSSGTTTWHLSRLAYNLGRSYVRCLVFCYALVQSGGGGKEAYRLSRWKKISWPSGRYQGVQVALNRSLFSTAIHGTTLVYIYIWPLRLVSWKRWPSMSIQLRDVETLEVAPIHDISTASLTMRQTPPVGSC